jgi:hypothetical protein
MGGPQAAEMPVEIIAHVVLSNIKLPAVCFSPYSVFNYSQTAATCKLTFTILLSSLPLTKVEILREAVEGRV